MGDMEVGWMCLQYQWHLWSRQVLGVLRAGQSNLRQKTWSQCVPIPNRMQKDAEDPLAQAVIDLPTITLLKRMSARSGQVWTPGNLNQRE